MAMPAQSPSLQDGRSIPNEATITTELCIVGAGPAGTTLARECSDAGTEVCLLESGGLEPKRATQKLARGTNTGYPYFPLDQARIRALGGSSHHWLTEVGLRARPLDPLDFELRPGIPHSGWPFGREHLDSFYRRAQEACGLGPFSYEAEGWENPHQAGRLPVPPEVQTVIFQFGPREIFRRPFDGRQQHLRVLLHSTAVEIMTEQSPNHVSRIRVRTLAGNEFSVAGRFYVLAAGGIDNARLLLLSNRVHRQGLGNDHDLVGRFFMEHLGARSGEVWPLNESLLAHAPFYQPRVVEGVHVMGMLSLSEEVVQREQLLNSTFFLVPSTRRQVSDGVRSLSALRRTFGLRPRRGVLAKRAMEVMRGLGDVTLYGIERLGYGPQPTPLFELQVMAEQAPNPSSRVMLGSGRDALGLPRARLDWRLVDLDRWSIERSQDIIAEAFCGLARVRTRLGEKDRDEPLIGQWHHLGTTRMHESPSHGVVDSNCRVHGMGNLFLAGSSVFPTGGYANPTLTIVSLALRLADHLISLTPTKR
jgi:choline dehydrogenase-like flavoprotein